MGNICDRRKHRHSVTVSTERVLACVQGMPEGWTTHDVAEKLNVSERAVRAAVQWLVDSGEIKPSGSIKRAGTETHRPYPAKIYVISPERSQCDVGFLNRILQAWA